MKTAASLCFLLLGSLPSVALAQNEQWTCTVIVAELSQPERAALQGRLKGQSPDMEIITALKGHKIRAVGELTAPNGMRGSLDGSLKLQVDASVFPNASGMTAQIGLSPLEYAKGRLELSNASTPDGPNTFTDGEAKVFDLPGEPELAVIVQIRIDPGAEKSK